MASKSVTKAERVAWMSKTSDIVGSHLKTDLDSYLTLIRRKVQEKCSTTHELITLIRRSKIGDSKFVTPNEFRFTLIKFGVIIAQPLVDIIFNVFDSDRSGSMDFDEFAMWIMNSEFKPSLTQSTKKGAVVETPDESLRRKLADCVSKHADVFELMKKKISFLEFVSEINRKNMRLTDVEARQVFLKFDPENTGFIDSAVLTTWARSGVILEAPPVPMNSSTIPSLATCINIVSVRNSKQMEKCFAHIPEGSGVKIQFEEFRRCLVQGGLGKNIVDARDLFLALGGASGAADIDELFRACKKLHLPENPRGDTTVKMPAPSYVSVGRAARHLRDAMRKSFQDVKAEIISKDLTGSGYISAQDLHAVIVKHCMPITFQDFRYIVQQLKTEDGGSRIDWHSFLHMYNPRRAPHQLAGSSSLPEAEFGSMIQRSSSNQLIESDPSSTGEITRTGSSPQIRPLTSAVASKRGGSGASGELRRMWQTALRNCHRSDPDRSGVVNRVAFISALESANLDNAMSPESMNKLADEYTGSSGLVDYMCCFREFLTDISRNNFQPKDASQTFAATVSLSPVRREAGASHPWDFQYKRERHAPAYWSAAATAKPFPLDGSADGGWSNHNGSFNLSSSVVIPPSSMKAAAKLSDAEKEALLAQYNPGVLTICSKCYAAFLPMWKSLRNELQRAQITSQRGSIIVEKFQAILEHYGAHLSKSEWGTIIRSFRGMGLQDVVKFDDFLRVCMLVKNSYV